MTEMSPKLLAGLAAAAIAFVALVGWFALVSPQRSKANSLDRQIADERAALTATKAPPTPSKTAKDQRAQVDVLATALPDYLGMPALLRQVQRLASTSNVSLLTFTPGAPVPLVGYEAVPIDISVIGSYGELRRFLQRLRVQANTTSRGSVKATGRLFAVESIALTPSALPDISATIRVDAFVFTGAPAPVLATTTTPGATP